MIPTRIFLPVLLAMAAMAGAGGAASPVKAQPVMSPVVSAGETADPAVMARVAPVPPALQWRILKTGWNASDERAYGEFVHAIGASDCRTVDDCLKGPANIYRAGDPAGMNFFADCADLPYVLRAYFAWKNGLPFSYAGDMAANGRSTDLRYSRLGNHVVRRIDVVTPAPGAFPDARIVLRGLIDRISTAMYRVPPETRRGELADFYPVRLAPAAIRPGTVIYDPNGHAAIVYDVDGEGRIRFIDSHPDNSVTRGTYGKRFVRASPAMGAGFKNWRPLRLAGATQMPDGAYAGGRIVPAADRELADWSDEQFHGTETPRPSGWSSARFVFKGQTLDYYDYVRRAVAGHDIVYDPLTETRAMLKGLCDDLRYRADAVDVAVKAGIAARPQPVRLPENIYGTSGDWETYSTPSRDARLKVAFQELKEQTARFLDMAEKGGKGLAYGGRDLAGDLASLYREEAAACTVSYRASDGAMRGISFEEARRRLFDMSFDPHHCPERRWGAREAEELRTCPDDATKRAWYEAERRLRNQTERTYDARMDFTLADLRRAAPGSGQDAPPDVDTLAALDRAAASAPRLAEGAAPARP
jgi:hypothetical protein